MKILDSIPINQKPPASSNNPRNKSRYYDFGTSLIEAYHKGNGLLIELDDSKFTSNLLKGGTMRNHVKHRLQITNGNSEHDYRVRTQVNADHKTAYVWIERIK